MKKNIITILSILFILFFILWASGCHLWEASQYLDDPYQKPGQALSSCFAAAASQGMLETRTNTDKMRQYMEERTGQSFEGWTLYEMQLMEMELNRLEKEKREAALPAQDSETPQVEQGLEATQSQAAPIDDPADKTQPAEQTSSDISCKEIIGTWTGESQKTRLTGTVTIDEETFDVNDMWGWWLEEPDSLEIQIWIENDKCFAKVENLDCEHVSFKNGDLVLIQEKFDVRFEGSLVQHGRLEGTYKGQNFLADPGAMIYGDWWVIK